MKPLDPERVQAAFNEHEAEIMLLRALVTALLDAHPNREKVIDSFRREASGLSKSAPPGTDQELLIEVQARLQIHLAALNAPYKPIV